VLQTKGDEIMINKYRVDYYIGDFDMVIFWENEEEEVHRESKKNKLDQYVVFNCGEVIVLDKSKMTENEIVLEHDTHIILWYNTGDGEYGVTKTDCYYVLTLV
jgi:hypothetical protein